MPIPCERCRFDNPEEARFCNRCGQALGLSCAQCGKTNPPGSLFCNQCSRDLRLPKEALRVDPSRPASYTPKYLADQILTSRSALEGERKLVTVLFADVANYTSLSERLDPEEVHQIRDSTEGFDTPDLQEAMALLKDLGAKESQGPRDKVKRKKKPKGVESL